MSFRYFCGNINHYKDICVMKKMLLFVSAIAVMAACTSVPKNETEAEVENESETVEKVTFAPENFPEKGVDVKVYSKGIQHIGIPTANIDETIRFYQGLGFEVATRHDINGRDFAFVNLGNLYLELIPREDPAMTAGAVDHFCLDVKNIEELYKQITDAGYTIITDGIQDIAFWEKGARYFFIQGPNNERIEFCEIL